MRWIRIALGLLVFASASTAQTPAIGPGAVLASIFSTEFSAMGAVADTVPLSTTGIYNNYSFIPAGMPNHVVAPGSIIAIKGSNLGPSTFTWQPFPLQNTFGGVTISVTVNGTTVQALLYYIGATQLAAVLPSTTPTGDGTYTVTVNGQTSTSEPITVVPHAFGILTDGGTGSGQAQVFDFSQNNQFVTLTQAAHPGDVLTFWGSGLGAITSEENNITSTPANLTGTFPLTVLIAGQSAPVLYAGRSTFPGLDIINVTVPAGVTLGCSDSVVVQSGDTVSNTATIAVTASGSVCSADPITGMDGTQLTALATKQNAAIGSVALTHLTSVVQGADTTSESALGEFGRYQTGQTWSRQASYNSCIVHTFATDQFGNPTGLTPPTAMDAGTVTVTSGSNTQTLMKNSAGIYSANLGSGGFLTANVGAAGASGTDVSAFSVSMTAPSGFVWSNRAAVASIDRTAGQVIQWSNAAAGSSVVIFGTSLGVDSSSTPVALATFSCVAPASPGSFTIPDWVLRALPPSSAQLPGALSVSDYATPVPFQPLPSGLDAGFLNFYITSSKPVTYLP